MIKVKLASREVLYHKLGGLFILTAFAFVIGLYYLVFTSTAGSFAVGLGRTAALGPWYIKALVLSVISLVYSSRRLRQGRGSWAVYSLLAPLILLCYEVYDIYKALLGFSFFSNDNTLALAVDCLSIACISIIMIVILAVLIGMYNGVMSAFGKQ